MYLQSWHIIAERWPYREQEPHAGCETFPDNCCAGQPSPRACAHLSFPWGYDAVFAQYTRGPTNSHVFLTRRILTRYIFGQQSFINHILSFPFGHPLAPTGAFRVMVCCYKYSGNFLISWFPTGLAGSPTRPVESPTGPLRFPTGLVGSPNW